MHRLSLVSCLLVGRLVPAGADYARPEQHGGLRDIVLIYRGGVPRTAKEMLPLVAHVDAAGQPREWFFDGFLFLTQQPEWAHPKTREQMEGWLDALFGKGGLLPELQQAMQEAERRLGPPPKPRQVMVSVPYPDAGGGPPEARLPDIEWFIDQTVRRWREANAPSLGAEPALRPPKGLPTAPSRHLSLWGTYWYWEDIASRDRALVRGTCDATHRRGMKILWIPWFRASGWDQWRQAGFDLAIMQPNYAFMPPEAGRHLPDDNRLTETARLARQAEMGVEMETRYALATSASDRANLRLYLNHALEDGWTGAVRAHFHSFDQYQRLAASPLPEVRQLYDDMFALYAGRFGARPVSLLHGAPVQRVRSQGKPEAVLLSHQTGARRPKVEVAAGDALEVRLDPPLALDELRIHVAGGRQGTGLRALSVYGRSPGRSDWLLVDSLAEAPPAEGGWLLTTWPARVLSALRVVPEPFPGKRIAIGGLASYPAEPTSSSPDNLALGRSYTVRPGHESVYPDSGGELTDGILTGHGFADGRTVGWSGAPRVVVDVSLPEAVPVEAVRCHVQGGGYGAVHFPRAMSVAVSDDGDQWRLLGDSPVRTEPAPVEPGAPDEVALQWMRQDGPAGGEKARHVRVTLVPGGWLMLSEVEVLSGGRNVVLRQPYRFRPRPRCEGSYCDDGTKLTDGTAAPSWEQAVGWEKGDAEVEVDLGGIRRVREVRAYVLGGGAGAVYLPEALEVSLSADGETWTPAAPARIPRPEEKEKTLGVWASAEVTPQPARHVRLRLKPSQGWMMLGEVEVLGSAQ